MQKAMRSSFLAPFRADRATTVSNIIVRMVVDDVMQEAGFKTQRMSVYSVSAFLAETLFLVKTPPTTTKLGSGLPSSHGGHLRDFGAQRPRGCPENTYRAHNGQPPLLNGYCILNPGAGKPFSAIAR